MQVKYTRQTFRHCLIAPADKRHRLESLRGADTGIKLLDFEDSVSPANRAMARQNAEMFFAEGDRDSIEVRGLRMNALSTTDGVHDLSTLLNYRDHPKLVIVPKVESPRDIDLVASVFAERDSFPLIFALIETPMAVVNLKEIVRSPRLGGLFFGAADYAAATSGTFSWNSMLFARSAVVASAASVGVPSIDTPYFDLEDKEGLRAEAELAKELGFWGKSAVHPRQLPVIDEVFAPTSEELSAARQIAAAGQQTGRGITAIGGRMVGAPFYKAADAVIARDGGADAVGGPLIER